MYLTNVVLYKTFQTKFQPKMIPASLLMQAEMRGLATGVSIVHVLSAMLVYVLTLTHQFQKLSSKKS